MAAHLDPIDREGNAYRVLWNGKQIGTVRRNMTLGEAIWQHKGRADHDVFRGVFSQKEQAAEQLTVDYVTRKKT